MTNEELIQKAVTVLKPYTTKEGRLFGDVGAAVLGQNEKVYLGVSVDTPTWGLCAERSAIASMVTDGEYRIQKVAAVWKDNKTGELHVLPPCGVCREFMRNVDSQNLNAEVILGYNKSHKLSELLPEHDWPEPLE